MLTRENSSAKFSRTTMIRTVIIIFIYNHMDNALIFLQYTKTLFSKQTRSRLHVHRQNVLHTRSMVIGVLFTLTSNPYGHHRVSSNKPQHLNSRSKSELTMKKRTLNHLFSSAFNKRQWLMKITDYI